MLNSFEMRSENDLALNIHKGWTGFDLPDESEEIILFYDFNEPGYYKSHTTEALSFITDYGIFCVQVRFSKIIATLIGQ